MRTRTWASSSMTSSARKRIHSALGYLTPAEFEAAWQARQHEQQSIAIP
jgi:hypothetical protein